MSKELRDRAEAWVRRQSPSARGCCLKMAVRAFMAGWRARASVTQHHLRTTRDLESVLDAQNERLRRLTK